jgi:hypothetical protein
MIKRGVEKFFRFKIYNFQKIFFLLYTDSNYVLVLRV